MVLIVVKIVETKRWKDGFEGKKTYLFAPKQLSCCAAVKT